MFDIQKKLVLNGLIVTYIHRSPRLLHGRFGGGWQWCIGVEVGSKTVILNCLFFMLRFDKTKTKKHRLTN